MIQTIYAEVPREKIEHLTRAEFINGQEHPFHDALTASMSKYGFRDPVYCWYNSKNWGDKIKIIVGNNRMVVAKELNIPIVPAVITNFKADESPLEGKILNTDDLSKIFRDIKKNKKKTKKKYSYKIISGNKNFC